jgi:hypothetical protein
MCWSSHRDYRDSWVVERQPRADARVSDADRQATIDQLSRHTADGRLTLDDFEERVDEAWQAKTHGDLQHVLRELPVERATLRRRYPEAQLRRTVAFLLIIVGAALLLGPWSLWWLVPLAFFRFRGFGHHHQHRSRYDEPRELRRGDDLTLV